MNGASDSGLDDGQLSLAAGCVLDNVRLNNVYLRSGKTLTGELAHDCLYRDLKITGNLLNMQGVNELSISGVLSGGEFCANGLQQVNDEQISINLYPGRIGSNIADDGLLFILSFKAGSEYQYGEFIASANHLYLNNAPAEIAITDLRNSIPQRFSHCAAALLDFDYQTFYRQYTGWTVRDFQARDAQGYARLFDWLERREEEYCSGVRVDTALPAPLPEKRTLGADTLIDKLAQARMAMAHNKADFRELRLAELPYLPLRNYMLKRLALRNAELAPLPDLGEGNAYRQACLQFLLPKRAFSHVLHADGLSSNESAAHNSIPESEAESIV